MRSFYPLFLLLNLATNTPAQAETNTPRDGFGICMDYFRSLGETSFASDITVEGGIINKTFGGTRLTSNAETSLTITFPDKTLTIAVDRVLLDYYLQELSYNEMSFAAQVTDSFGDKQYYIAFPEVTLDSLEPECINIRLLIS